LVAFWFFKLTTNGLRLGVVADFTTNVHTKNTVQIYEKLSYEARHPPLRQTAVTSWRSVFSVLEIRSDKGFAGRLLLLCRLCVGGFKNFRREGNFKK
jgi:hypothetical protein